MTTEHPPEEAPAGDGAHRAACTTLHGAPGRYPCGFVEVGPGTRAWLQPNGSWGETNAGLISGDGESLLVDTLWDDRLTARMLDAAEPVLRAAPLTTAVNTHRDGDHWWGNAMLPDDVRIWTSAQALAEMEEEPPPAALHRLARLVRLGRRLPGRVGRLARYTTGMLGPFAFDRLRPRRPAETFTGEHLLDVGGRAVHLIHLGPAHTAGDVVVHLPDAGVVFAGDLLFVGVTPVIWHGPVANWVTALDRLLALDAEVYVPGHGPLARRSDLEDVRGYWEWLIAATEPHLAAGREPGETMRRVARDPDFAPWRHWLCPERLALNVLTRHREVTGAGPLGHGPAERLRMFSQVAELARDMRSR
jgi:cyclase